jgi:hypothetical protein
MTRDIFCLCAIRNNYIRFIMGKRLNSVFSLISAINLAYLIGLLVNDMAFDVLDDESLQRKYYCQLVKSIQTTILGACRILIPCAIAGLCQLHLFRELPSSWYRDVQRFTVCSLGCIGGPLMSISMYRCSMACESPSTSTWGPRQLVTVIHYVMAGLLAFGLLGQCLVSHSIGQSGSR